MKAVILCGGKGGRIRGEEAVSLPKPLVPIGGRAMIHRVMDHYHRHGVAEFVLALGHRGDEIASAPGYNPDWSVHFEDTGPPDEVGKAGRLLRLAHLLREPFFLGYCDDLSDVDLLGLAVLREHCGALVAMTAARARLPFGVAGMVGARVTSFEEKPLGPWANVGSYCVHPQLLSRIDGDAADLEADVLPGLVREGRVCAMRHAGLWLQVNTPIELARANELHAAGRLALTA